MGKIIVRKPYKDYGQKLMIVTTVLLTILSVSLIANLSRYNNILPSELGRQLGIWTNDYNQETVFPES